ncbi:MAG: bifunctional UDP-N-acetylglucosamine diphosphorylase/glucosamine-1-phosphate N-acetyltransferase GlmU, partial [Anaerolineales bacterium]
LAQGVHMGNYGEVKNSYLGPGTKMGHFSYIGDANIGPEVNIGAGVITANYDGRSKYPTEIGAGAFIGSDTMLIAPLKIGAGARTGAGSVVTKDVPPNSLAVGMPARIIRKKEEHDGP